MAFNKHTLILKEDGTVWGCGYNNKGQLGLGNTTDQDELTQMLNSENTISIACGYDYSLILKNDGTVWGCGYNYYGQLDLGDTNNVTSLTQIPNCYNVKQIACGHEHTLILKEDGTVWVCGRNDKGQLGLGNTTTQKTLTQIPNCYNVKQIACGYKHTLILKEDGTVWGCGYNNRGQLGLGNTNDQDELTQMLNSENTIIIACGEDYSLILKEDGTVWGCGYNSSGQLGLGNTTNQNELTQMTNATDVKTIACGNKHTLILKNDGTVWGCGYNYYGQLGWDGDTYQYELAQTPNHTDVIDIYGGYDYSLILKSDTTVWACGNNSYGQLGLGNTTTEITTFTQMLNSENTIIIKNVMGEIVPTSVYYLIYANEKYYTISDDGLTLSETSVDTIEENGFTDFSLVNTYLSNNTPPFSSYQIVSNINVQLHTKSYKETYMMIFNDVRTINNIGNIENNIISCNSDKYDIYYTYSLDNGITWKTVNNVNNIIDFPSFTMPTNTTSIAWDNLKQLVVDNGIKHTNKNFAILNELTNNVDFKIIIALKMKEYIEENETNSNGISKVQLNTKVFV